MKITPTRIPEVLLIEPQIFRDARGFFLESWNAREFCAVIGSDMTFVQDNHSQSKRSVLRGLHYQIQQPQGKLVRAIQGAVYDVAVDLRSYSETFGRWVGTELTADSFCQIWIPPGFAHGFLALSDNAEVIYKTTDYYAPEHERSLIWNDADVGIAWPLAGEPIVSAKDKAALPFARVEVFR